MQGQGGVNANCPRVKGVEREWRNEKGEKWTMDRLLRHLSFGRNRLPGHPEVLYYQQGLRVPPEMGFAASSDYKERERERGETLSVLCSRAPFSLGLRYVSQISFEAPHKRVSIYSGGEAGYVVLTWRSCLHCLALT